MRNIRSCCLFLILLSLFSSVSSTFFMDKKVIKSKPLRASLPVLVGLDAEAFKSKYVIDDVLALMQSLVDASQKEVDDYNANWNVSLAEKQSSLAAIITSLNTQGAACSDLSDQLNALNDTIIDLNEQINEYNQSISDNQNKTDSLLASRCEANKNYVKGLKNNKKTLSLVAVLRAAIQQFNETLLQRHVFEDIHQRLIVFLNKHSSLLQTKQNVPDVPDVQERTADEIGTGYIDNPYGEITVSDFDSETVGDSMQRVKTKLLKILDNIESGVKSDMQTAEANEIAANIAAANVKLNLDVENRFLNNQILTLQKQLTTAQVNYENELSDWQDCQTAYDSFKNSYDIANQDLKDSTANYNSGIQKLNDELTMFQEVLYMYQNQVASAGDQYKARTDDYADDQTFNDGNYFDNRTIYNVMDSLLEKKN